MASRQLARLRQKMQQLQVEQPEDNHDNHDRENDASSSEDAAPFNPFALLGVQVGSTCTWMATNHAVSLVQEDDAGNEDDDSDGTPSSPPAATAHAAPSKSQRRKQKLRTKRAEAEARAKADQELDELLAQHAPANDSAATETSVSVTKQDTSVTGALKLPAPQGTPANSLTCVIIRRLHPNEELRQRFGTRMLRDEDLDDQPSIPGVCFCECCCCVWVDATVLLMHPSRMHGFPAAHPNHNSPAVFLFSVFLFSVFLFFF